MTLDDAFSGLLQYLAARPNGGSRTELLQFAVAAGFEEPLLAEWLDVFLAGFVEIGYIAAPDYDAHLAPRVAQVGVAVASKAAQAVFLNLTQAGGELDLVRKENAVVALSARVVILQQGLTQMTAGRATILSTFPAGPRREATLSAVDFGIAHQRQLSLTLVARRDLLLAEIAAAGS